MSFKERMSPKEFDMVILFFVLYFLSLFLLEVKFKALNNFDSNSAFMEHLA